MNQERRRSPRRKPDVPVPAQIRSYLPCQVLDLSTEGVLLRVRKPLRSGAPFWLRLTLAAGEVELAARARHCRLVGFDTDEEADRVRAYEVGLEFERPVPELLRSHRPGDAVSASLQEGGTRTP